MHSVDSNSANHLDFKGIEDKLPPQNIEAEEVILGGILLDPDAMDRVVDILCAEAFYVSAHKDIYQAAKALHNQNKPIDLLTVTSWLTDNNLLVRVGGRKKLATLVDRTVSAINIDAMAEMVMDKYLSRKLISCGNEIVKLGYQQSEPIVERIDASEQKIFAIRHQSQLDNEPQLIGDVSPTTFEEIERLSTGEQQDNIPTGFYDLDAILGGGFQGGQLVVVAGRPSMGKSAIAHQLAYIISLAHEAPTMVFSLEMSINEINRRFVAFESGIPMMYLKSRKLSHAQWEPLSKGIARVNEAKMVIDDTASQTLVKIRSKVRTTIIKRGSLKLVVIDYLQLMVDEGEKQLAQRVGELTRGLKLLARECNVPIILLSQLNRGPEGRTNKRPMLSDLRDSGRIEEDADLVLGLYRDEYYNPESPDRGVAEVIILKNRNGETGTLKLLFDAQFTSFKNLIRS